MCPVSLRGLVCYLLSAAQSDGKAIRDGVFQAKAKQRIPGLVAVVVESINLRDDSLDTPSCIVLRMNVSEKMQSVSPRGVQLLRAINTHLPTCYVGSEEPNPNFRYKITMPRSLAKSKRPPHLALSFLQSDVHHFPRPPWPHGPWYGAPPPNATTK